MLIVPRCTVFLKCPVFPRITVSVLRCSVYLHRVSRAMSVKNMAPKNGFKVKANHCQFIGQRALAFHVVKRRLFKVLVEVSSPLHISYSFNQRSPFGTYGVLSESQKVFYKTCPILNRALCPT